MSTTIDKENPVEPTFMVPKLALGGNTLGVQKLRLDIGATPRAFGDVINAFPTPLHAARTGFSKGKLLVPQSAKTSVGETPKPYLKATRVFGDASNIAPTSFHTASKGKIFASRIHKSTFPKIHSAFQKKRIVSEGTIYKPEDDGGDEKCQPIENVPIRTDLDDGPKTLVTEDDTDDEKYPSIESIPIMLDLDDKPETLFTKEDEMMLEIIRNRMYQVKSSFNIHEESGAEEMELNLKLDCPLDLGALDLNLAAEDDFFELSASPVEDYGPVMEECLAPVCS